MLKEIIVSEDDYETRAALLENKVLAELFIERKEERYILGNIYKGRVTSVLPGMQAAFIDIGLDRNAFLHVSDVAHHLEEFEEFENVITDEAKNSNKKNSETKRVEQPSIRDLLKKGQEILVQIDKEPMDTKGPRVTAYITLPGRYLVYMPTVEHIGVSRKIESESERQRLKEIIERLRPNKNQGFIIRTAAEGKGEEEFQADIEFLTGHW
jgi:ribonuclease G